jgi:uncharacterized membrane protein
VYIFLAKPYEESILNIIEIFNEIIISLATYILFFFSGVIEFETTENETYYKKVFGWIFVAVCVTCFSLNVLYMLANRFILMKRKLVYYFRLFRFRLKLKKALKW